MRDVFDVLTSVPLRDIDQVYGQARREAIDVGIMEPSTNVATIPARFGWNDIGSWGELFELSAQTPHDNVQLGEGRVLTADSRGNLVFADGRTVALVGVEGLVVVETQDAVFVCPRERAQDVRLIVQQLRSEGAADLL